MLKRKHTLLVSLISICFFIFSAQAEGDQQRHIGALPYRHIGPTGNRPPSLVGIPGPPKSPLVGAASGGI